MAIYHCSVKIISRSSGRSSVAASAYRSGEKIINETDGVIHDYSKRKDVVESWVTLPIGAPEAYRDRSILWNAVEKKETRINSQTSREIEVALPIDVDRQGQILLINDYVKKTFLDEGMCADIAIHDKGDGNPHAHVMLTTREVTPDGFTVKNREWNNKENVGRWRESWASMCNEKLRAIGSEKRVDHRSHIDRGMEEAPTIHMGASAWAMEKRGIKTDVGNINRAIKMANEEWREIQAELERQADEIWKESNPSPAAGQSSLLGELHRRAEKKENPESSTIQKTSVEISTESEKKDAQISPLSNKTERGRPITPAKKPSVLGQLRQIQEEREQEKCLPEGVSFQPSPQRNLRAEEAAKAKREKPRSRSRGHER